MDPPPSEDECTITKNINFPLKILTSYFFLTSFGEKLYWELANEIPNNLTLNSYLHGWPSNRLASVIVPVYFLCFEQAIDILRIFWLACCIIHWKNLQHGDASLKDMDPASQDISIIICQEKWKSYGDFSERFLGNGRARDIEWWISMWRWNLTAWSKNFSSSVTGITSHNSLIFLVKNIYNVLCYVIWNNACFVRKKRRQANYTYYTSNNFLNKIIVM